MSLFLSHFWSDSLGSLQGLAIKGDAFNNINKSNVNSNKDNINPFKNNYQQNVEDNKKAFTLETAGKKVDGEKKEIPGNYGVFNQLNARGESNDVINDYVENKQEKEIEQDKVATKNNLEINKDLNSNKAQEKYRTYKTREGESIDIVNNVRNENEKNKGLIKQQTNAVDAKKQELQTNYDKEESVPGPVKAATGAVGAVVSNVAKTAGAVGEDELKNDLLKAKNKGSNMLYDTFSNNKESSNLTTQNTEAKPKENLSIGNNTSNANTKTLTLSNEPRDNQNISQNTSTDQSVVNNVTAFKEGNNQEFVDLPTNHSKSPSPKTYAEEAQDGKEADAKIAMQNSSLGEVSIDLANQKDSSSQGMAIKDELPSSQVSTMNADQPSAPNLDNLSDAKNSALQDAGSNYADKTSTPESSSIPEIKTESLLEENLSKERPKVVTKVVEKESKSNQQADKEAERMKKLQE